MPHELSSYRFSVPGDLRLPEDGWFELDLQIRELRASEDRLPYYFLVFIEPGKIRLRSKHGVVWTTRLRVVESKE